MSQRKADRGQNAIDKLGKDPADLFLDAMRPRIAGDWDRNRTEMFFCYSSYDG